MRKGFTLIELIVVIAIIAILAAIIAPNAFKAIEKASRSATLGDFRTMKTASIAFYADTGTWPITDCEEALLSDRQNTTTCDVVTDGGIPGWDGPYIEQWPSRTRWGGVYALRSNVNISWSSADASGETAGGDDARYIRMNGTPVDVLGRLDAQIDGTENNTTGQHRWDATPFQYMLISTDVALMN